MNHQSSFADFDWSSERITTIFHHFFICLLKEVGQQLLSTGQFALEFETFGRFKYVYLRFWRDDCLVKSFLCRFGVTSPPLAGEMGALSRLLSSVSTKPQLVAVSGCPVDFIQVVDESNIFAHTLQSPFRFDSVDLQAIMHRDSYSVFKRIDFFSVLQGLIVSLGGSLSLPWTLQCPELSKVISYLYSECSYHSVFIIGFVPRRFLVASLICQLFPSSVTSC